MSAYQINTLIKNDYMLGKIQKNKSIFWRYNQGSQAREAKILEESETNE